ncbi:MAG: aminoglycoside phosphotransferase family protein [Pseudomonadota bacterium]
MLEAKETRIPELVLAAYNLLGDVQIKQINSGLINASWLVVNHGQRLVLQRLNDMFSPAVNQKIERVTEFLQQQGMCTTTLLRTRSDSLQVMDAHNHCWRALSYVEGETNLSLSNSQQAAGAGRVLARFHQEMSTFSGQDELPISTVHNLRKHQDALEAALQDQRDHENFGQVATVAEAILGELGGLPSMVDFPLMPIHGDPKISNFLFDEDDNAIALIDLDTIGRGHLIDELGDAFRSWCNPRGEDTVDTVFDLNLFEEGLRGYVEAIADPGILDQLRQVSLATESISLELASRFCADALNESYFAWDKTKYASASEHQLVRAKGQYHLAQAIRGERASIDSIVSNLVGS